MTWVNVAFNNFVGGEVSPDMYGRFDIPIYKKSCETMLNFVIKSQGPVSYRTGFKYVNSTRHNNFAVLKEFVFNDDQAYVLEFTDTKLRFFKDQAPVLETAKTITGISTAAQAVITSAAHGYSNDNEIFIYDVVGPDALNGKSYFTSDVTTDTYKIKDVDGNYISTASLSAYVSGGTTQRVYEITTPFTEANDLEKIQVAQNADTMYIVHPLYQPQKLTRTSNTSWAIAAATSATFPFTTADNYPRAVAFAQGRLWFGGTIKAPDKFWGSRGPESTGASRYDDFTTGTAADNAVVFILAPPSGKVEAIQWMAANNKYLLIGTYGGVNKVTGGSDDEAVLATAINVRQLTSHGCFPTTPLPMGSSTFFIQRSGLVLRDLKYDLSQDTYVPEDLNLISSRIVATGIKSIKFSSGRPDVVWATRKDGLLLGITTDKTENVSGWHRHIIGGKSIVEGLAVVPRATKDDQLWAVHKRTINGKVRRYVEYLSDEVIFPLPMDFYTGAANKESDFSRFKNAIFNKQREYTHLDCHLTYNGSTYGKDKNASLTLGTVTGTVTITSSAAIFKSTDVGREIWGAYTDAGVGGGRYRIKTFTSATVVVCDVLSEPDSNIVLAPGGWYFTTDTISGVDHLEAETIQVVADGGTHPDVTVSGGRITLEAQHSVIHVGYQYRGIVKTLNVEGGGMNGDAQAKSKRITELAVRFQDTLGASVGTDIYNMEQVLYASTEQLTGRPPLPSNAIKKIPVNDEWIGDDPDDITTQVVIVQDYPLPCTVQLVEAFMETTNE